MNRQSCCLKRVSGAILDLDGTILDTMSQWDELGIEFLHEHGIEPKLDLMDRLATMSIRESADFFHKEYGINLDARQIAVELVSRIRSLYTSEARLKPGALNTLRTLKLGGAKIALATATSNDLARAGLQLTGALKYFDGIFSCRDPKIKASKSSKKIYDAAREFLGTPLDETIVVEDALYAIETAKKAGYFVVGIEDESERRRKDSIVAAVDVYVKNHSELNSWLIERFDE